MAGSWKHATTEKGKLRGPEALSQSLETGGDVWEFAEEAYGMVWWMASQLALHGQPPEFYVEQARKHYRYGIDASPGIEAEG